MNKVFNSSVWRSILNNKEEALFAYLRNASSGVNFELVTYQPNQIKRDKLLFGILLVLGVASSFLRGVIWG